MLKNPEQTVNTEEKLTLAFHRNCLILLGKLPLRQILIKLLTWLRYEPVDRLRHLREQGHRIWHGPRARKQRAARIWLQLRAAPAPQSALRLSQPVLAQPEHTARMTTRTASSLFNGREQAIKSSDPGGLSLSTIHKRWRQFIPSSIRHLGPDTHRDTQ